MTSKAKLNVLTGITALVVTIVRHGVEHHWGPWEEWLMIPGGWVIHLFGLMLVSAIGAVLLMKWQHFFVGADAEPDDGRYQYYIVMTILFVTIAIGLLSLWPPADDL